MKEPVKIKIVEERVEPCSICGAPDKKKTTLTTPDRMGYKIRIEEKCDECGKNYTHIEK